ncbi:MAG: NADH-quinone oxidoreductase, partial [Thermoplasmata archaeon]
KKIKIYVARCIFCSQCNDICPVGALNMSSEFLLASDNKLEENLIVE